MPVHELDVRSPHFRTCCCSVKVYCFIVLSIILVLDAFALLGGNLLLMCSNMPYFQKKWHSSTTISNPLNPVPLFLRVSLFLRVPLLFQPGHKQILPLNSDEIEQLRSNFGHFLSIMYAFHYFLFFNLCNTAQK
jgi:hypothetical protein